ncbi:hypothetical protein Brms1b_011949 [Colletotrichum noveboracense]|nr:hypothetical protein COL940_012477 [Colletotrichum noveboracense]KAJ0302674.1 hypothetical protein Brms1b_011949 [Colletotrichum noveboracense]
MHKSNHSQLPKERQSDSTTSSSYLKSQKSGFNDKSDEPESRAGEQPFERNQNSPKFQGEDHEMDDDELNNFIDSCEKIFGLYDELDATEKPSKYKSDKSTKSEEQINNQLERELETTKEALRNKTDELASVKEQHAKELLEARENKEKCRCKDKDAYLESVEEHVEKLRGTMEDVLRHVSTYQGRKRRRTEGPDFEL